MSRLGTRPVGKPLDPICRQCGQRHPALLLYAGTWRPWHGQPLDVVGWLRGGPL